VEIAGTVIDDTFAEAFGMRYLRLIVTAHDQHWLDAAQRAVAGYGTSIIACDAEIAVEQSLSPDATPDGRPGMALLAFGFSADALAKAIANRTGQCLMTCPTTAVYDGLDGEGSEQIPLGKHLRFFGDGYQKSKLVGGRRYWRIPVMDGEFLVVDRLTVRKGVAGGNIILQSETAIAALDAARRASQALATMPGVITPFPGGVARSGSKVGSRYKALRASTADAYCPTLRGRAPTTLLDPRANCAYEIVIDGCDEQSVATAMATAIRASAGPGVVAIGAGNYGGKLGKFHFHLHQLLAERPL
jgi:formylmethanofuran--tetrahydromethanopterin N-formyltransferase